MTATEERLLDALPIYYGGAEDPDPIVQRWIRAVAHELDMVRALLIALRDTTIPARADDTVDALARWEAALNLPVRPPVTVEQRRTTLLAFLIGRRVVYGQDWTTAVSAALGGLGFTVEENTPAPNNLRITIPYGMGYTAGQAAELIRSRTPANQIVTIQYTGFIVGESLVGDDI